VAKQDAQTSSAEVAEVARPYQKLIKHLSGIAELDSAQGASFDIASQVVDKIVEAQSLDDIFLANETGLAKAEDYINVPLNFTDVSWHKAGEKFAKGNLGVYGVFTASTDQGMEVKFSTGAVNVVASVAQAQMLGYVTDDQPLRAKLTATETPNGTLLKIARA